MHIPQPAAHVLEPDGALDDGEAGPPVGTVGTTSPPRQPDRRARAAASSIADHTTAVYRPGSTACEDGASQRSSSAVPQAPGMGANLRAADTPSSIREADEK